MAEMGARYSSEVGRLHDLQVLLARVRDEQAIRSAQSLRASRHLDDLAWALEQDCRRVHAQYMWERVRLRRSRTGSLATAQSCSFSPSGPADPACALGPLGTWLSSEAPPQADGQERGCAADLRY
jgi:hypothetical protein